LLQVRLEIKGIFDASGKAQEILANAYPGAFSHAQRSGGGGGRM
jgi:hypothetical protein